jgi:hypothetical protein
LLRNNFPSTWFDERRRIRCRCRRIYTQPRGILVLALLVVIAIGALVVGAAAIAFGGHRRFNEVDRFHRASQMTTAWARAGVTKPLIAEQDATPDEAKRRQRQRSDV